MPLQLLSLQLATEADLVLVRQRTRTVAEVAGFDVHDQTRLAAAVSEIARNAIEYAGGGKVAFEVEGKTTPQSLTVVVTDHGPGIPRLERVLSGQLEPGSGRG